MEHYIMKQNITEASSAFKAILDQLKQDQDEADRQDEKPRLLFSALAGYIVDRHNILQGKYAEKMAEWYTQLNQNTGITEKPEFIQEPDLSIIVGAVEAYLKSECKYNFARRESLGKAIGNFKKHSGYEEKVSQEEEVMRKERKASQSRDVPSRERTLDDYEPGEFGDIHRKKRIKKATNLAK